MCAGVLVRVGHEPKGVLDLLFYFILIYFISFSFLFRAYRAGTCT